MDHNIGRTSTQGIAILQKVQSFVKRAHRQSVLSILDSNRMTNSLSPHRKEFFDEYKNKELIESLV